MRAWRPQSPKFPSKTPRLRGMEPSACQASKPSEFQAFERRTRSLFHGGSCSRPSGAGLPTQLPEFLRPFTVPSLTLPGSALACLSRTPSSQAPPATGCGSCRLRQLCSLRRLGARSALLAPSPCPTGTPHTSPCRSPGPKPRIRHQRNLVRNQEIRSGTTVKRIRSQETIESETSSRLRCDVPAMLSFSSCAYVVSCFSCQHQINTCPVCMTKIQSRLRVRLT